MSTASANTPKDSDAELDALLAAVAQPPSVPETLALRVADELPELQPGLAADIAALAPGALVDGHYRVERVLGRGGMGVVYEAENLRTGKRVALKCMSLRSAVSPARLADNAARFRREARAVARIQHPNVVDVYDAGGSSEAPYLVMELLEGESLRERMRSGPMPWPEARALFLPVLAGVAAAHRVGIVHRDLKPDNIFLARQGEAQEPLPKVLDFGIASVREGTGDEEAGLTRTGTLLGTPLYMAPEQLRAESVDARTDVYALGVVLYEMLSARLPYTAPSASALAVLQAIEPPLPLSQHRAELRGPIESAVMRALARKPEERHASVSAFAAALQAATLQRGTPLGRRLALGALFASALAAGLLALTWGRVPRASVDAPTLHPVVPPPPQAVAAQRPGAAPASVADAGQSAAAPAALAPTRAPAPPRVERRARPAPAAHPAAAQPRLPTDLRVDEF